MQASKAVGVEAWEQTTGKHMVRMWRTLTVDGGFPGPHLQAVIPHKQHLNCRYTIKWAEPEKCIVVEQQSDVIVYCCSLISVCVCVCVCRGHKPDRGVDLDRDLHPLLAAVREGAQGIL